MATTPTTEEATTDPSPSGSSPADPRIEELDSEGAPAATLLAASRILLVDDNLQNLELMQAYLEGLPCRLTTARDGIEAIAAIEHDKPDLVLLDVMMPRMSGFEVCQKIKSNPTTRDIVVIMVTALHEVGDYERAVECGTDDFLTKPVNKLELVTRVKSLLRVSILKRKLDALMNRRDA
ncbi:MAG: response regulator [Phycisphaerae bacterium]|nr:response regulator [Phycisphaerae bacterium]